MKSWAIPGYWSLLRLDKEVRRKGKRPIFETRYAMSSLNPNEVSTSQFKNLILGHWEVENCLHLPKDRYYEEDKHVVKGNTWGQALTVLTNIAVSLTQLLRHGERTLYEVREKCHENPKNTAKNSDSRNIAVEHGDGLSDQGK